MLNFKLEGKKVIVRGNNSGVQYGEVVGVSADGELVQLKNSRRVWYWSGAASITQLAEEGVKNPTQCKFSMTNTGVHIITDTIEIIECTPEAIKNIEAVPIWKM